MNSYQSLIPLIEKKALLSDPVQFHSAINITFHKYESAIYDKVHEEMWKSLPVQLELIASDLKETSNFKGNLKLLDIGCGTGLATEMLLSTNLKGKIEEIHLIDTSSEMLKKAKLRSAKWGKNVVFMAGDISVANEKYDLIIVSSVLHHIPDIPNFLKNVSGLQSPGGVLITIHDPSFEAIKSDIYKHRCEDYEEYKRKQNKEQKITLFRRVLNKLWRLTKPDPDNYIEKINNELLKEKIIKEPLSPHEIWSVTDLHIEGLPYSANDGISKKLLENALADYSLLSYRTYGFFGTLCSNLDQLYQKKENDLILSNDLNGRNFSSVWRKKH